MTEKEINAAQFNHEASPRCEAVEGHDPDPAGVAAQRTEETRIAVNDLAGRFDKVEEQLAEFHRRSAHRESVIDMLHEENQQLRLGIGRVILEPIVADLIRLYDQIDREVRRLKADGQDERLLWSFADDITQILDRCGVEVYSAQPGDPFDRDRHRPLGVVTCTDESQHNTVAEVAAAGFAERETGRVRRPVQARFYQYEPVRDDGAARSQ
jgi:molecular chaperone GrpE